jgi:hypothetical protein
MAAPSKGIRGPGTRTGSTSGVEVSGLNAFRRELKTLENSREWTKELGALNRVIAKDAAADARAAAEAMGGVQKHFAAAIKGYGAAAAARIRIADERANAAFWGAKQRTGWNAGNQAPNQPEWVGNSWDVAVRGQGPYAINDSVADNADKYAAQYGDGFLYIARRAFPDRT